MNKYVAVLLFVAIAVVLGIANSIYSMGADDARDKYLGSKESIKKIELIEQKYRDKITNKRYMTNFLARYKNEVKTQRFNKNDVEFLMGDLEDNILNSVIKELYDKNYQIVKLEIKRANDHKAEIFVKVKF
jgi:hypothetical protein